MMVVLLVGFSIWKNSNEKTLPSNSSIPSLTAEQIIKQSVEENKKEITLTVYLSGGVVKPGLYKVAPGSRVHEAINMAGGFTDEADQIKVNMAKINKDGAHILVPLLKISSVKQKTMTTKAETKTPEKLPISNNSNNIAQEKININTASLEELMSLPGIGAVTAQKIVDYRNKNGSFKSVAELDNVVGIGQAKLEKLISLVSI